MSTKLTSDPKAKFRNSLRDSSTFTEYNEVHYEVVLEVQRRFDQGSLPKIFTERGTGGLWELAEDIAVDFLIEYLITGHRSEEYWLEVLQEYVSKFLNKF